MSKVWGIFSVRKGEGVQGGFSMGGVSVFKQVTKRVTVEAYQILPWVERVAVCGARGVSSVLGALGLRQWLNMGGTMVSQAWLRDEPLGVPPAPPSLPPVTRGGV